MELQFMLLAAKPVQQSRYKVLIANCSKIYILCFVTSIAQPAHNWLKSSLMDYFILHTDQWDTYISMKNLLQKRVRIKAIFHGKHWCMKLNKIEILLQKYFHHIVCFMPDRNLTTSYRHDRAHFHGKNCIFIHIILPFEI